MKLHCCSYGSSPTLQEICLFSLQSRVAEIHLVPTPNSLLLPENKPPVWLPRTQVARSTLPGWCKGQHPPARGDTYDLDVLAGAQAVVEAHPVVVVRVLPVGQHVHVPGVVGPLVGHPGASIHADGVAAAQVGVEIGAVAVTLVVTAQEVLVFIEGDLK